MITSREDERVLLRRVSWETYERLLTDDPERVKPLLYYDRGALELMCSSLRHEVISQTIASLVEIVAFEAGLNLLGVGRTTFKVKALKAGFEADQSFYFSPNAALLRGRKEIDPAGGDPPPDLVVEVDVSGAVPLDKLPIYARIGVREVWRYAWESGRPEILGLSVQGGYEAIDTSTVLPALTRDALARLVEKGMASDFPAWVREVRGWVRRTGGRR